MPPDDETTELAFEHGIATAQEARSLAPGTPVFIYSGFRKEAEFESLIAAAHPQDLFGAGEMDMVRSFDKTKPDVLYEAVREHHQGLADLTNAVDLTPEGDHPPDLSEYDKRILRIYARSRGGVVARYSAMDGGRSSAHTLRLEVIGPGGGTKARVVAKLNRLTQVVQEAERFDEHVAGRLGAGLYADSTRRITAGAGPRGGTFYSFASAYPMALFKVLADDPARAAEAVRRLQLGVEPWQLTKVGVQQPLGDVLHAVCETEPRLPAGVLWPESIKQLGIALFKCSSHGDLHGGNVLVDQTGAALLIDFADATEAAALLDPITLELSVVLHPDSPLRSNAWSSVDQADQWADLDRWLEGCPCREYVRACREWQQSVSRGSRDPDAVMLAYCLRQLTFPDAREDILAALIQGALRRLEAS